VIRAVLIGVAVLALGASQAAAIGSSPNSYYNQSWAPDGTALIHQAYAPGAQIRRLTLDGKSTMIGGPDIVARLSIRNELALVAPGERPPHGRLRVRDASGRGRVIAQAVENGGLGWSPDGTAIAFQASPSGRLATVRADGSGLRVYPHVGNDPAWSPDGTRIAFSRGTETVVLDTVSGSSIVVGKRFVYTGPGGGQHSVAYPGAVWSPDSTRLAIRLRLGIQIVRSDGSGQVALLRDASFPSWSPDGSELAFQRDDDILAASADGSAERAIVASPMVETTPTWSPDGRWIAYTNVNDVPPEQAYQTGHATDIHLVRPDGSERRSLTGGCGIGPETPVTWVCLVSGIYAVPLAETRAPKVRIPVRDYPRAIRFPVYITDGARNVYGARVTVTQVSGPRVQVTSVARKAPSLLTDTGGRAAFRFLKPKKHGTVTLRVVAAGKPRLLTLPV
jgi:dipeptidyl aminopeptidase/acylaminoacyl peptidase